MAEARLTDTLEAARTWLVENNKIITTVAFLIISSVLIGQGVGDLGSAGAR